MTKSEQAIRLIIQEGITAAEAANRLGISRAAVSKAKLYPSKTAQNIRKLCEMQVEIEKLTAQRDELLEALAIAEPVMDAHAGPSRLADFRAAIASVKGVACKHCGGKGISQISDPCICQYGVKGGAA